MSNDMKYVEVNVKTMKCDAPTCDYITSDVSNDTIGDYLHKPCPLCGESLLTDEDYEKFKSYIKLQDNFNKVAGKIMDEVMDKL